MLHVVDYMRAGEVLHEEAVHEALQRPMFDDNWETHASRCQIDFDFKSLVSEDKVSSTIVARSFSNVSLPYTHSLRLAQSEPIPYLQTGLYV